MPDAPLKLFVSYRSADSAKVDSIVTRLRALKQSDNKTDRFQVWQDKTGIPAGKDWWVAIVDAIIDCQIFIFFISEAALASQVCLAELAYADQRNRPVIPVVLEGEYYFDPSTGKEDLTYWDKMPSQLAVGNRGKQLLFYSGASFYQKLNEALAEIAKKPLRDVDVPRPSDPRPNSGTYASPIDIYSDACEYAGRMDFKTSRDLFRKLVTRNEDFAQEAHEWITLLGKYEELVELDARPSTRFRLPTAWTAYKTLFPKVFLEDIFDPKGFSTRIGQPPNSQPATNGGNQSIPAQNTVSQQNQSGHNINVSGSNNTIYTGGTSSFNASPPVSPTSSNAPKPSRESFNALVSLMLLLPQIGSEQERRVSVTWALDGCRVLNQINWGGTPQTFTVQLLQTLSNFGQCSPGKPALVMLLEHFKSDLGDEKQAEFDRLIAIYSPRPS